MKKAFIFLLLILLVLILPSCSKKQELLYYQNKEIFAECTLNNEYKINITKKDGAYSICFTEPSELSSITFYIGDTSYALSNDGTKMPLPKEHIKGIYALCNVFSLNEESITSAEPYENNCAVYSFLENDILYEITYNKNSIPIKAEITSSDFYYEIAFDAIRLS